MYYKKQTKIKSITENSSHEIIKILTIQNNRKCKKNRVISSICLPFDNPC